MHSQLQMRSLKQLINALAEMEALGVAFVSLRDNLDLSTPSGCLMFQIIGACQTLEQPSTQRELTCQGRLLACVFARSVINATSTTPLKPTHLGIGSLRPSS